MLQVRDLHKSYGDQILFDGVGFVVGAGERIGLVGRNGHGKTTLFRMILGEESPDAGEIVVPDGYRIGHVSQHLVFDAPTVLDVVLAGLPPNEDGWQETHRAEAALLGLGFAKEDLHRPPEELSGGFQVRLNLAKMLVSEPDLLLLDEPNNYLDILSLRWLRSYLSGWRGELMLITHDRELMDAICTHTLAIHRLQTRKVEGGTAKVFAQIQQDEEVREKTRVNEERKRRQEERFIERFRAKATKARAVQSRIKMIEKRGTIEKLEEIESLRFAFRSAPFNGKWILEAEGLTFGYEDGGALIDGLDLRLETGDRLAIVGRNGKGKSTLIRLLAGELTPWRGEVRKHVNAEVACYGQANVDRLSADNTVEDEILAAQPDLGRGAARGICGLMMFEGDQALKKIAVLSGGEKSRVLLGKLLVRPANLLLLDEPTNHLDMQATDALVEAIEEFDGTVVLVTHSEMLLDRVANRLAVFDRGEVKVFEGGYRDFLERVGWEEEGPAGGSEPRKGASKKELRRQRAEIIAARGRALRPLDERVREVEDEIVALEESVRTHHEKLCRASEAGDADVIADSARESRRASERIEILFADLERLSEERDALAGDFEAQLAQIDDAER